MQISTHKRPRGIQGKDLATEPLHWALLSNVQGIHDSKWERKGGT